MVMKICVSDSWWSLFSSRQR